MSGAHLWLNRMLAVPGVPAACLARATTLAERGDDFGAFRWFSRAARVGLPEACYRLGRCYLLGLGVPPGINEALRWLRRAAESGDAAARAQLVGDRWARRMKARKASRSAAIISPPPPEAAYLLSGAQTSPIRIFGLG